MNHCKTCKHWDAPNEYTSYPLQRYTDEFECEPAPRGDQHQHNICSAVPLVTRYTYDEIPEVVPKAFTQDASGYMALLWTAPDFGCVLYEPHEPVTP